MTLEDFSLSELDEKLYETARQYNNREGFDLVSCREVGLPIYRVTVQAITQVKKKIPPIEEFVLKAINSGLASELEIGQFLGLEPLITRDAMINLRMSEDIDLIVPEGGQLQEWTLSKRGQSTLREAKNIVPEERTFTVNFDGLLLHVKWYGRFESRLLRKRDLRDRGILEIPPSKYKPPELGDLKITDVDEVIRKIEIASKVKREQERDLLALKAIERRDSFFLLAQALVYKSRTGDDPQVAFVVDGRLDSGYEAAFARVNGVKKLRILEALKGSEPRKFAEEWLGREYVKEVPLEAIESLKREVSSARIQAVTFQEQLEIAEVDAQKSKLQEQLDQALKKIEELEQKLAKVPMDWLEVYDYPPLLKRALEESQERLLIVSPWIRATVVNRSFLQQFEKLLQRNVRTYIGYGLGETQLEKREWDVQAEKNLQKLAQKYKNFTFKRLGNTHAKVLISDSHFAANGSFNWLSFKGDPNRTFRDERGAIAYDARKIDELFDSYMESFDDT
ncbi:MAG: hypothetical protein KME13_16030 [Myxacorys californica WJT36-NPBG1]|jgi:hypothetical protein|nr:hypothetical protein [Myxacorys californica WJT36-NPBG1]